MSTGGDVRKNAVFCVFCGSSSGSSPVHLEAATELARVMHSRNIRLVYGGGTSGLMGRLAYELVRLSGPESVHGIIPTSLAQYERPSFEPTTQPDSTNTGDSNIETPKAGSEEYLLQYGRITTVADMHTRKRMMADEVINGGPGSGFVAISGGYGTFEELMEVTTWNQLGIHDKGIALFNVDGYWDGLVSWISNAVQAGFVAKENGAIIRLADSAVDVVRVLEEYRNSPSRYKLDWTVQQV